MKRLGLCFAAAGMALWSVADMPQGLVLRFSCDEFRNSGQTLPDVTGSNNNGRVTGVRAASAGRLNGGCEFTGKNSFVQIPSAALLDSPRVTFCLWLKTGKAEWPDRTLIEKRADSGYALRLAAGDKQQGGRKGKLCATVVGRDVYSDMTVADNAWHHAAVTYDGEAVKLYVDGILQQQTVAWRGEVGAKGQELTLGMNRSDPSAKEKEAAFEGSVDEVLVFNRALTAAEVKDALAATKPKFTKQQVERRLKELKDLFDRGLILKDFYDRKVEECEVSP
ncbi:MAG TPA: LamG domain-containing protein [Kiritimatiellia bacterium]|nr:LamG domain-containing protein [Kiritimatiellia bacterium]HPS06408.1 LamG domain-containing protein [Kiritimatiellia bacterium]